MAVYSSSMIKSSPTRKEAYGLFFSPTVSQYTFVSLAFHSILETSGPSTLTLNEVSQVTLLESRYVTLTVLTPGIMASNPANPST